MRIQLRTTFTLFLLLIAFCAGAQTPYFTLSGNYSGVVNSNRGIDHLHNTNPAVGLGLADKQEGRIGWNTELQYSVKGFKVKGAYTNEGDWIPQGNSNLRTHYLDFTPTLVFGQKNLKYLIGGLVGMRLFETHNDKTIEELNLPESSFLDLGFLAGCKFQWNKYWLRLTYNQGMLNAVQKEYFTDVEGNADYVRYYNSNVQLSLGVNLRDPKKAL